MNPIGGAQLQTPIVEYWFVESRDVVDGSNVATSVGNCELNKNCKSLPLYIPHFRWDKWAGKREKVYDAEVC